LIDLRFNSKTRLKLKAVLYCGFFTRLHVLQPRTPHHNTQKEEKIEKIEKRRSKVCFAMRSATMFLRPRKRTWMRARAVDVGVVNKGGAKRRRVVPQTYPKSRQIVPGGKEERPREDTKRMGTKGQSQEKVDLSLFPPPLPSPPSLPLSPSCPSSPWWEDGKERKDGLIIGTSFPPPPFSTTPRSPALESFQRERKKEREQTA